MSQEVISLIYAFLNEKDATLGELFKRQFDPDVSLAGNFPSLEQIVQEYIRKTKKVALPKTTNSHVIDLDSSLINIARTKPSDFLERIVNRNDENISEDSTSSSDSDQKSSSSSDSETQVERSAAKRRRTSNGTQKLWDKKKQQNKRQNKRNN